jgi:hypothetical protein
MHTRIINNGQRRIYKGITCKIFVVISPLFFFLLNKVIVNLLMKW